MSWISGEISRMTLDDIERELTELHRLPLGKRSVESCERLRQLEAARQRIANSRRGISRWFER